MCRKKKLIFYYGTMASGKSLQLLSTAYNFQEHSIPFIILKSTIDTRDGTDVVYSRALGTTRQCVSITPNDNIFQIMALYNASLDDTCGNEEKLRWILVDEAQFLTPTQVEELAAIADIMGIGVMCYGLKTDFKTHLFPGSKRLIELADTCEEIKSSCFCDSKTIFNARVNADKEIVTDGEQIEIGGDEKYISYCRKCYFEKIGHPLYRKFEEE